MYKFMGLENFKNFIADLDDSSTTQAIPPNIQDLYSLYRIIKKNNVLAVTEFGSGFSTSVIALALSENKLNLGSLASSIRHPNPFSLMTVDCSAEFMNLSLNRIPQSLRTVDIKAVITSASMNLVADQICHLYDHLPAFTSDLYYLDGPGCDQVTGGVNGFSVNFGSNDYSYGLPMSADLILIEPYLWPGTIVVTDGRGANAQFLLNNFKRNWEYSYDEKIDQHIMILREEHWGPISKNLLKLRST